MGKQVNFYMTEPDEEEFVHFLRSDMDICIFMDAQPSSEVIPLKSLPNKDVSGWFLLWLWHRRKSPTPEMNYITKQKYYMVDSTCSEVIEFLRSFIDNGHLTRGRIWAEMSYWDLNKNPPVLMKKSDAFNTWYNRIANWIKRRSVKNQLGDYLLPDAVQYVKNGGKLRQVPFAKIVKIVHH